MAFNIHDFKAITQTTNYTKANKFLTRFNIPAGLGWRYSETVRYLEYWCEGTSLPGVNIAAYEGARYSYGSREKRPFAPIFQDIAFTVLLDGEGKMHDFFGSWARLITNFDMSQGITGTNSAQAPYELTYKSDYLVDVHVATFRDDGQQSHNIILRDAFPLMIGDVRGNWADNSIARLPVVIAYNDWYKSDQPFNYNLENGENNATED